MTREGESPVDWIRGDERLSEKRRGYTRRNERLYEKRREGAMIVIAPGVIWAVELLDVV